MTNNHKAILISMWLPAIFENLILSYRILFYFNKNQYQLDMTMM